MFHVLWTPDAVEQIEGIVARASDPEPVLDAMRELDRMLRDDPEGQSESRDDPKRVAFARPLGVLFEIDADQVTIGLAWLIRPV